LDVRIKKAINPHQRDYYDRDYFEKSERIDFTKTTAYRCLCEAFNNRKIVTFIDIGCGIGNQLKPFKRRFPHVVGIDVSAFALRKAKMSLPSADFIVADARFLPFRNHCMDGGMCISLIEHLSIKDGKRVLEEIYRVSKCNAPFVVITPDRDSLVYKLNLCYDPSHIHLYATHELRGILTSVGFTIKRLLFSSLTPELRIFGSLLKCEVVCIIQCEA